MADEAIVGHLNPPQMAVGHMRPAAIGNFYNGTSVLYFLMKLTFHIQKQPCVTVIACRQ